MTRDWYRVEQTHKKVTLCDVHMCRTVTCHKIARALMGMGLCEWETHMSHVFSEAVLKAFERGEKTADITKMFSCDLVGVDDVLGNYTKQQKQVCAFLREKLFKTISETDDELKVSLKWDVLKK